MTRAPAFFLLAAIAGSAACLDDVPEAADDDLLIEAKGTPYTPDNMIRVVSVNFYKGSFGEEKSDARNFLYYLAHEKYVPDILAVQNLKHSAEGFHDCQDVANKLSNYLKPKTVNYGYYYPSVTGGACVIYRAGRFQRVDQALGLGDWKGPNCSEHGMSSVGARLRDTKYNNKTISIVSVHMPGECTQKSSADLRDWVSATSSDIKIIAGDFNTNVGEGWGSIPNMKEVFQNAGFRLGGADIWGPLDWLWRKGHSDAARAKRVEYAEANGPGSPNPGVPYSDHRGGFEDLKY
jgi:hypothetical protein